MLLQALGEVEQILASRLMRGDQVDALHVAPFDEPLGLPDRFIEHGSRGDLLRRYGLAAAEVAERCARERHAGRAIEARARDLLGRMTLAEKLGQKVALRDDPEVELFRELGFVELRRGAEVPDFELALDEPVHFFFVRETDIGPSPPDRPIRER